MDFIERLTGLSPDGGSGSLEFLLLIIPLVLLLTSRAVRSRRNRRNLRG